MISKNAFADIINAVEEYEELVGNAIDLGIFSSDTKLNCLADKTLDALSNDLVESIGYNPVEDELSIPSLIFNFCYDCEFGKRYVGWDKLDKPLVKIGDVSYKPSSALELYDMILKISGVSNNG